MTDKTEYLNELLAAEAQQLQIDHDRKQHALALKAQEAELVRRDMDVALKSKLRSLSIEFEEELSHFSALAKQMERFIQSKDELDLTDFSNRVEKTLVQLQSWFPTASREAAKLASDTKVSEQWQRTVSTLTTRNATDLIREFDQTLREFSERVQKENEDKEKWKVAAQRLERDQHLANEDEFMLLPGGIAKDRKTNLEWLRFLHGESWMDEQLREGQMLINKYRIDAAVREFNRKGWGGHCDWRVPTIRELHGLLKLWGGSFNATLDLQDGQPPLGHQIQGAQRRPFQNLTVFPSDAQLIVSATPSPNGVHWHIWGADGRILNYDHDSYYLRLVRG